MTRKTKAPARPRDPELAKALRDAAKCAEAFCIAAEGADRERIQAARGRSQAASNLAAERLQRYMASVRLRAGSGLYHLADGLSMGLCTPPFQQNLRTWADFFAADRPSVQGERAATAAAFIRETFAKTGKPVASTRIAKHLHVKRDTVKRHIYPILRRDETLVGPGRGPAAGWKPRD